MDINQDIRYARIFTEEFYLLNLQKESNKTTFTVSGSTANVYKVSLYDYSGKIFCNCPDAKSHARFKHVLCKHVCFVLFKVLKNTINKDNTDLWKNLYLSLDEKNLVLDKINTININDNECVNKEYIDKYQKLKDIDPKTLFNVSKEIDIQDDCPICYDILETKKNCVQCPVCNNVLHLQCINKWLNTGNTNCPYCRSNSWENFNTDNSYINLDL